MLQAKLCLLRLPSGFPAVSHYFSHTSFADDLQVSRGKTQNSPCVSAGFIKHTHLRMEDFAVTCQLVQSVPHLVSGSCSSPRTFGLGFLQTPPHGDAPALLLAFGSPFTWHRDFHPISSVPCPAHTQNLSGAFFSIRSNDWLYILFVL